MNSVIDTRVLGKGVRPFGGDLVNNPWSTFKFVWLNYVGAVSPEIREKMRQSESFTTAVAAASLSADDGVHAAQLAYMLSQVLEGGALVMIMNVEESNGFEMWRRLVKHYEPDLGSHAISGLRQILAFKFRSNDWSQFLEDLETFEHKILLWQKMSGEVLGDSLLQAVIKEQVPEEIKSTVDTNTYTTYGMLKVSLATIGLTKVARGVSVNWIDGKGKGKW